MDCGPSAFANLAVRSLNASGTGRPVQKEALSSKSKQCICTPAPDCHVFTLNSERLDGTTGGARRREAVTYQIRVLGSGRPSRIRSVTNCTPKNRYLIDNHWVIDTRLYLTLKVLKFARCREPQTFSTMRLSTLSHQVPRQLLRQKVCLEISYQCLDQANRMESIGGRARTRELD
ncbi:hypothetical protein E4U53_005608 [Claviceps sorghi]|nr:hypothetical protein E4U53_005608 [Claviceps sorghi]